MLVDSVVFCAIPIDTCNVVTETPCISDGLSTSCRGIALTSIYFIFFSSLSPKSSELQRSWNFFDILKQLCSKFNAMEKQNQLNSDALNKLCKFHSMKIANSPIIIEALLKLHHYHCIIIRRRFSHSHHFFFFLLYSYIPITVPPLTRGVGSTCGSHRADRSKKNKLLPMDFLVETQKWFKDRTDKVQPVTSFSMKSAWLSMLNVSI